MSAQGGWPWREGKEMWIHSKGRVAYRTYSHIRWLKQNPAMDDLPGSSIPLRQINPSLSREEWRPAPRYTASPLWLWDSRVSQGHLVNPRSGGMSLNTSTRLRSPSRICTLVAHTLPFDGRGLRAAGGKGEERLQKVSNIMGPTMAWV